MKTTGRIGRVIRSPFNQARQNRMDHRKMPNKSKHPSRSELFKALTNGRATFKGHLSRCPACRDELQLLKLVFPEGVQPDLETPAESHLAKLDAIPILAADRSRRRVVPGELAYDSWSGLSPVQIRDAARGFERRLRLKAGQAELEIVAERELAVWKFSAQVYIDGKVSGGFALKVGRTLLTPEFGRCFFWSSERPPRTVHLLSTTEDIVFRSIAWPKE
jgi:hypothetical protein